MDNTINIDQEQKIPLLQESATVPERPWRKRKNGIVPRLTNCGCLLVSLSAILLVSLLVMVPVIYFHIVPNFVAAQIRDSPNLVIQKIGVEQIYAANESIGIWFEAYVPTETPEFVQSIGIWFEAYVPTETPEFVQVLPSTYTMTLLSPNDEDDDVGLPLGLFDMDGFTMKDDVLGVDFYGIFHDPYIENLRTGLDLAGNYFAKQLQELLFEGSDGGNSTSKNTTHAGKRKYRLGLQGRTNYKAFQIQFPSVPFYKTINFNFELKDMLKRTKPQFEIEPLNSDDENLTCLKVYLSLLNPTVLGLNFGNMGMANDYVPQNDLNRSVKFADVEIENFNYKNTYQSPTERQDFTMKVCAVADLLPVVLEERSKSNIFFKVCAVADLLPVVLEERSKSNIFFKVEGSSFRFNDLVVADDGKVWIEEVFEATRLLLEIPKEESDLSKLIGL
ncbi:hypothetical protein MP638_001183 [Amoeboaphelidium occidentale]|nr:hypothetical protein MP638_001183 [Amoeboaphelidium occidentale]